jgi:CHASE2 domain-containing sensor protein
MAFLTVMLANEKDTELKEVEKEIRTHNFHKARRFQLLNKKTIELSPDMDDMYRNRIRFFLIPKNTLRGHPGGNLFNTVYQADEAQHGDFQDKIVIIGNSSPDAGDLHSTPVGNMAGMYIIGHAINTISHGIQPSHSPPILNILIETAVIVMAAYLFLHLHSFLAQIVGSLILIVILGGISYYCFRYHGIFLNFLFAVIGMRVHRVIANIEKIIEKRGKTSSEH